MEEGIGATSDVFFDGTGPLCCDCVGEVEGATSTLDITFFDLMSSAKNVVPLVTGCCTFGTGHTDISADRCSGDMIGLGPFWCNDTFCTVF